VNYDKIKEQIRHHEGYRNKIYKDHLGNRTIGYGHLCLDHEKWNDNKVYSDKVLNQTFEYDFSISLNDARRIVEEENIHPDAFSCVVNLCFNMGGPRVSKFHKMIAALDKKDYATASKEMLDSKWARQVPNRARELSEVMQQCSN
jgi:lysozyme